MLLVADLGLYFIIRSWIFASWVGIACCVLLFRIIEYPVLTTMNNLIAGSWS